MSKVPCQGLSGHLILIFITARWGMYQVLSFTPTLQMRKLRHSDDKYIVQDHRVSRARIGTHGLTVELPLLNHGAFSLVPGPAASVCRQKTSRERKWLGQNWKLPDGGRARTKPRWGVRGCQRLAVWPWANATADLSWLLRTEDMGLGGSLTPWICTLRGLSPSKR